MAADFIVILAIVVAPLLLGVGVLRAMGAPARGDFAGYLGHAIVIGSVFVAALMGVAMALRLPLNLWTTWSMTIGSALLAWGVGARRVVAKEDPAGGVGPARTNVGDIVYFLGTVLALALVIHTAWHARLVPILIGDEAAIWTPRARYLLLAGAFDDRLAEYFRGSPFVWVQHADYPLFNPLLQAHALLHVAPDAPVIGRVPVQLFGVALVLMLVSALRARVSALVGVPLLLIVVGVERATLGMQRADADLMLATALLGVFDGLGRFVADGDRRRIPVIAMLSAAALWTKHDAAVPMLALVVALLVDAIVRGGILRRLVARKADVLWGLVVLAPVVFTIAFNTRMGLTNDLLGANVRGRGFIDLMFEQSGERIGVVLSWFWNEQACAPRQSGLLILLFFACIVFRAQSWRSNPDRVAILAVLVALGGYALVLIGSFHPIDYILDHAAARLIFHVLPTMALVIAAFVRGMHDGFGPREIRGASPVP